MEISSYKKFIAFRKGEGRTLSHFIYGAYRGTTVVHEHSLQYGTGFSDPWGR